MAEARSGAAPARRLHLLRHAKSDWSQPGAADPARTLNERGRSTVPAIAAWLVQDGAPVDYVLCSSAVRARETVAGLVAVLPAPLTVEYDDALYAASASDLLARLQRLPAKARCVVVCGHNPGLQELGVQLAGDADTTDARRLREKLPTAGVVTFDVRGTWGRLSPQTSGLSSFVTPKSLAAGSREG